LERERQVVHNDEKMVMVAVVVSARPPADAFLANLDMSAVDDAENLGLVDEDNMKLDDHDLNDTGRC
jgi:hypothetical protein